MKHCLSAMIRYGVFLILLLLTFGCRKDLCYDHELHSASVKTVVAADWEQEWERVYDFDWEQNWNVLWGHWQVWQKAFTSKTDIRVRMP